MGKADCRIVRVGAINTTPMRYKVHSPLEYNCRFVKPLRVDRRIKTLDVAPSRLLVGVGEVVGSKAYTHDVIRPEDVLDGSCDSGLCLALGEVVSHECRTDSEFGRVANSSIPRDAYD